jgi:hypothetical protein
VPVFTSLCQSLLVHYKSFDNPALLFRKHKYLKLLAELSEKYYMRKLVKGLKSIIVAFLCIGAINYHKHDDKILKPSKFCIALTNPNKFIKLGEELMRETCACE